ncbi:unnamed protein product [Sphagnum balticum]
MLLSNLTRNGIPINVKLSNPDNVCGTKAKPVNSPRHMGPTSLSFSVANPTCEISTILESFLDFQGLLASGGYEQKAGLSARETGAGMGYDYTDPLQSAANPQQTGQMSNVPSLVLIPTPAESHWVQLLDFCKELEECDLYWFA